MEYDQIPLTEELKNTLQDLKASARGEWVFCDGDGEPYKYRIHLMKNACKRAKVKSFGFHAIRHLAASMLAEANIPITTIQKILRHKSSVMTAHYLHTIGAGDTTRKALSAAMERMKG